MTPDRPRDESASIEGEVPEADALEQAAPLDDDVDDDEVVTPLSAPRSIPPDVPEADAIEQSIPAPLDDDEVDPD